MIGGELQDRLIPVPYSKSATDQAIRVVNAFRSGVDPRNNPAQTAFLKRASAAGLASTAATSSSATKGFSFEGISSQTDSENFGKDNIVIDEENIYEKKDTSNQGVETAV